MRLETFQAAAATFRLVRQPSKLMTARPVPKSGRAAGRGFVASNVISESTKLPLLIRNPGPSNRGNPFSGFAVTKPGLQRTVRFRLRICLSFHCGCRHLAFNTKTCQMGRSLQFAVFSKLL